MSDLASALAIGAEEQTLVRELKAGSEAAFTQLIAHYSRPVYSLIARSLRDPADAADVTQEVFVKVFRNIHSFHGEASLRTWIYRIAVHEASNQRRWWSRHKQQELTLDDSRENEDGESLSLADMLATADASPFDNVVRAQLRERVEAALHTIPEVFRTAVVLREIEGLAYDEIAEILETNVGTVKSRLMRGRAALREALRVSLPEGTLGAEAKNQRVLGRVQASELRRVWWHSERRRGNGRCARSADRGVRRDASRVFRLPGWRAGRAHDGAVGGAYARVRWLRGRVRGMAFHADCPG